VPLTRFQKEILALLARNRAPDSYLAGGAALHFQPNSLRYSNDLDYFHDSEERVTSAYGADRELLLGEGYGVEVLLSQPGFLRATVARHDGATRVDWAHDSAWRFMPPVRDELGGYLLHEVDLAVNKVLALAGRDEPRDFVDILFVHDRVLPLGALCWAAAGKDPGFTPLSLLEMLRRRGRHRPEELAGSISRCRWISRRGRPAGSMRWPPRRDLSEGAPRMRWGASTIPWRRRGSSRRIRTARSPSRVWHPTSDRRGACSPGCWNGRSPLPT